MTMHDSHRRCEFAGCTKWPLYAFEGEKAKYCSQHKDEGMVDVRSRRCQEPSCTRQPSFGFEHQKPRFCAAHKDEGMVDVVSRRCEEPECRRRPLYGHEGEKGRFCSYHKSEGMVDVVNKRCQHVGCKKRPVFGFEGEKGRFCSLHRSGGMVDVVSRRCDSPGCKRQPSGSTDASKVQFCSLHRGDGRAGYTLLMLARERNAASQAQAQALEKSQKRAGRTPAAGSWPGEEMAFSEYRPRWDSASSANSSFSSGQPTPGSAGGGFTSNPSSTSSFLSGQRASTGGFGSEPAFLSGNRRNSDGGLSNEQNAVGVNKPPGSPQKKQWLWTSQEMARRPPPIKNPAEAGVLGIAGRPSPPLDSARGDSPSNDHWNKPNSAHAVMYPQVKRHCSPQRRSFSHSPEPGSRSIMGLTGSMAGLQASSPASPSMGLGVTPTTGGTPSPGAMGIPTPPGSSGALPPPHGAPRRSAQRLPQPQFQNRAVPPRNSSGPPRPPRSLSPGNMASGRGNDAFYGIPGSGRSPVSGVGFSPSGGPSTSPGGGISGVFSPGSVLSSTTNAGGGLSSTRSAGSATGPSPTRWASPRNRAFGHSRTRSQGSVADTLEDLSIVDPGPPTLEPLRNVAGGPLRSPRDRWRGVLPDRRNSEIILPLPDRTQPEPSPGPATDGMRRSFTASLFDQPGGGRTRPGVSGVSKDDMDTADGSGGSGSVGGVNTGDSGNTALGGQGVGGGNDRWGGGGGGNAWRSTGGDVSGFHMASAAFRQSPWPQHLQTRTADDGADAHVEAKETRRGSHVSVGTLPLTSSESIGDREGGVFFSAGEP